MLTLKVAIAHGSSRLGPSWVDTALLLTPSGVGGVGRCMLEFLAIPTEES